VKNFLSLWDAASGKLITSTPPGQEISSAHFNVDGKRFVTASNYKVQVWGTQTGKPLLDPFGSGYELLSAQFSPDGKRIFTIDENSMLSWDAQSGQPLTEPLIKGGEDTTWQRNSVRTAGTSLLYSIIKRPTFETYRHQAINVLIGYCSWPKRFRGRSSTKKGVLEGTKINPTETIKRIHVPFHLVPSSKPLHSIKLAPRQSAMLVSSVHSPGLSRTAHRQSCR